MADNGNKQAVVGLAISTEAAAISATGFAILWIAHGVLLTNHKTWFFILMFFSALAEVVSMTCRALTASGYYSVINLSAAYLLPVVIPTFMAAACYIALGRLMYFVTPPDQLHTRILWIPPRWITPIFFSFDVVAVCLQFVGAAIIGLHATGTDIDLNKVLEGYRILIVGVAAQLLCFALFAVVGVRFYYISRRWTPKPPTPGVVRPWMHLLWVINVSAALLSFRSLYRIFEFTLPSANAEWMFYTFDAFPLSVVFAAFLWVHPGTCLPQTFTGFRLRRARTQTQGPDEQGLEMGSYFQK